MHTASYKKHILQFKFDAATSRGVMREHTTWFIFITDSSGRVGVGECAPLPGLSRDPLDTIEQAISKVCSNIETFRDTTHPFLQLYPALRFALETAWLDVKNGGVKKIFDTPFYTSQRSIPINGLVWMGDKQSMIRQIDEKLESGFTCLKLKIGALDFDTECSVLDYIRSQYPANQLALRLDANGAFRYETALAQLIQLSKYSIDSIEQPIPPGNYLEMCNLCENSPFPIALDEELIGEYAYDQKIHMLQQISPQAIVLKPTLLGGFAECREWIKAATQFRINWWLTSALESTIGLNAICQFADTYNPVIAQGLGTGQLYHNNVPSPLTIQNGCIVYESGIEWGW